MMAASGLVLSMKEKSKVIAPVINRARVAIRTLALSVADRV